MSFYAPMLPNDMAMLMMDTHGYRKGFYKDCCNRFRPFDPTTSRLFEALEAEEEEQKQELIQLIYGVLGNEISGIKNLSGSKRIRQLKADGDGGKQYFFVINSDMAKMILQAALRMECETRAFYERLCSHTKNHPLLRLLFERLSMFVENHKQILEEAVGRFQIQAPPNYRDITKN